MKMTRRGLLAGSAMAAAAAGAQPTPAQHSISGPVGRRFTGEALREIAFPLGGIGTGTVSLGGFGNLRDWEIFNRPNKHSLLPFTFVAVRLSGGELKKPLVRVLERQPLPPFAGQDGVPRETTLGLPRFPDATFTGSYPFAHVQLRDRRLPVSVALEAFNPMIPLETADSSLPVAILTYRFTSRATAKLDLAVAFSMMNPAGYGGVGKLHDRRASFFGENLNQFRRDRDSGGLLFSSAKYGPDTTEYGTLALVTSARDLSYRAQWEHGEWWDDFQKWWDEFHDSGRFHNVDSRPSPDGTTEYATLAAHFALDPGEAQSVTFALAWHFPNTENYWTSDKDNRGKAIRNQYGQRWRSAWEPAEYALRNLSSLRERSLRYRDALYASTLAPAVIDAVSSQASILRTTTVMVLDGNRTLAFEGSNDNAGCCPMNCTHVYNYEQAMAHLYPELERSMRETDFLVNMRPDGSMSFRTPVPLRQGGNDFRPAADGQMGCVMKVYREWLLSGDDAWLRKLWPEVKRALEYAWAQWDANRDGVMEGEQHNTYDIEFYGPNSMMGTLYLGALAAAARMARHLGETETAATYEKLAREGGALLDRLLWNGEYYVQKVDESHPQAARYQYGEGCLSDQLLGQWFAEVVALGKLLPPDHIRTALGSIFRYNFREDFSDFPNAQRLYALDGEKGLLLCSWPRDKRPALPFVYSDEVWTGIEYQVAAHLIYEGMVAEGVRIVEGARQRYDGARRNPWDEFECGHHYARAMSSWSLVTALAGFSYSAPEKEIGFRPRVNRTNFRCLFSAGTAWGTYAQTAATGTIAVEGGALELKRIRASARRGDGETTIELEKPVRITKGEKYTFSLR